MTTPADVLEGRAQWAVVHGDCLDVLPTLPDKSVAHVVTDPPYSAGLYARTRVNPGRPTLLTPQCMKAKRELASLAIGSVDGILDDCALHFARLTRRWMVIFHDVEIGERWRKQLGAAYLRTGAWVKNDPMPQISGDRPAQGFEPCTIAHGPGRKRWNGGGRAALWFSNRCGNDRLERPDHPCPKPLGLMMELLSDFTDPSDIVLDPFCGSSTTGVACLRLGRRYIGIEKDPIYFQLSVDRMRAEEQCQSLSSYRAGQLSMFGVGQ